MRLKIFTISLFLLTFNASAENNHPDVPLPEDADLGPEVQILQSKKATIEEFRTNGKVYMIKVTPKKGPAYYLVDADGDGDFDTRRNDLQPNLLIPSWVLFSW